MPRAELSGLSDVGDIEVTIVAVAEVVLNALTIRSDNEDDLVDTSSFECLENVFKEWAIRHREHRFRTMFGERPEAFAFARGEHDCFHTLSEWRWGLSNLAAQDSNEQERLDPSGGHRVRR
jgi:hypothetical protein